MDEEDDAPDRRTQQYGIRGIRYPHIAYVATDTCTSTVRRLGAFRVDRPAAFLGFAAAGSPILPRLMPVHILFYFAGPTTHNAVSRAMLGLHDIRPPSQDEQNLLR